MREAVQAEKLILFQSDYSLGNSLITLGTPKCKEGDELPKNRPLSAFEIAAKHGFSDIHCVDEALTGFFEAFKIAKDTKIPIRFGWKVAVVGDGLKKDEESLSTESKVIIWIDNDDAYYKLCRFYTKASTDFFYYTKRLDWATLNEMWDDSLFTLSLPFYSNFIARNSMKWGHAAVPYFGKMKPFIHLEEHELPFDARLRRKILSWNEEYEFPILESFTCTHYRKSDELAAMTARLIQEGGTWDKPNLNHYSGRFDLEYLNL